MATTSSSATFSSVCIRPAHSRVRAVPARRLMTVVAGLKENLAALPAADGIKQVDIPELGHSIVAGPGKMASVQIYASLADKYGGKLNADAAQDALDIYDEFVEDAKQNPGSHPNIDLLFDVIRDGAEHSIVVVPE